MWSSDTLWFEVAIVTTIIAVGSILLGHFEAGLPRWRRLLKAAAAVVVVVVVSATVGRAWAFGLLGLNLVTVSYTHLTLPTN